MNELAQSACTTWLPGVVIVAIVPTTEIEVNVVAYAQAREAKKPGRSDNLSRR